MLRAEVRLAMGFAGLCAVLSLATTPTWAADPAAGTDTLHDEVVRLHGEGKYAEAAEVAKESLAVRRRVLGDDHYDVAISLFVLGRALKAQDEYAAARPLYEESLAVMRTARGDTHPDVATSMSNLAVLMQMQGDLRAARRLYEQSLEMRRTTLGDDHPDVGHSIQFLASVLLDLGEYDAARPLYEQALERQRAQLGDDHLDVARPMNDLAALFERQGEYDAARPLYERSLAIYRREKGDEHPWVATLMNNLAKLLRIQGEYDTAQTLFEQGLAIRRATYGDQHPEVADSLNNLGRLYRTQGRYDEARPFFEESLAIWRAALGPDHPKVATGLNNLALLLSTQGDHAGARPLFAQNLAILRKAYGDQHPQIATTLNNLATLFQTQGDYAAARPLYERSLEIRRATLGKDHASVAVSLNNLGTLLKAQGDFEVARPLYEESIAMWRVSLGNRHPRVGTGLNNLATVLQLQGQYDDALPMFEESLAIRIDAQGEEHPHVAASLNNLARLLKNQGDYGAALPLYERSLELLRNRLGESHPGVATSLTNLASLRQAEGDLHGARELYQESLDIRRASQGPNHPDVAINLGNLALMLDKLGDPDGARALRAEAIAIFASRISLLDALSEREALAYLPTLRSILDGWLTSFETPEYDSEAWTHILRFKGAIAARLSAARTAGHADGEAAAIAEELTDVRRKMSRLSLGANVDDRAERLAALTEQRDDLERSLMQRSASFRNAQDLAEARPSELCEALPKSSALVDVLRYRRAGKSQYVAFTLMSGACEIERVELGPAAAIDDAIADWRSVIADQSAPRSRVDARGSRVAGLVWTPLAPSVGQATHLFVVPDSAFAGAPLSALPIGDGRYLIEDRAVTWLDRASDLLLPSSSEAAGALVVGNVDYDATTIGVSDGQGALAPCNDADFPALPGAAVESDTLVQRWRAVHKKQAVTKLSGAEATESAVVEALRGKAIVHLATHGFFATGDCKSALDSDGTIGFDPMVLSGLVLAGANRPADPMASDDGILTAAEVAGLDLSGTGLVVLSACETGLGEVRSGEGVLGLRRAFRIAGASTLVMTLWSVGDSETEMLMAEMYRLHVRRRRPVGAAGALRLAQLGVLERQRAAGAVHAGAWAGWIVAGDWR